jgi:hypothetical protein
LPYTVTLDGKPLARGTMQEVQAASAEAVTDMLAQDPNGVAMSAQQANRDFQSGTVEASVASTGVWQCPFWVHGKASTLRVIEEG